MLFEHFTALWTDTAWLLVKQTCSWFALYAVCDTIDLAQVSIPYLLMSLQHGEDLRAIYFVFNIGGVDHSVPIVWPFGCLCFTIDSTVFVGEDLAYVLCSRCFE